MVSLTLYGTETADTTVTTACRLVQIVGGTSASKTTKFGTATGYGELFSQGSTASWPAGGSLPGTPGLHGYFFNNTLLEGQTMAAGTWTVKWSLSLSATQTTLTSTLNARLWKRSSAGVYTQIGSTATVTAPTNTATQTAYTTTFSSVPAISFATGDKLYLEGPECNITVNSGGATTHTILLWASSSSTAGIAGQVEIDTPGYAPTPLSLTGTIAGTGTLAGTLSVPILVLYGSNVHDTTLTTADQMAQGATGGGEVKLPMNYTGTNQWAEMSSQAPLSSGFSALQSPTGNGWVYTPGAGSFQAGNWSGSIAIADNSGGGWSATNGYLRFYQLPGGVLASAVAIGSITIGSTAFTTPRSVVSFPATAESASATFASNDVLYIDLWWNYGHALNAILPCVYESNSATAGVASDMQITTAIFVAGGSTVALSVTMAGAGTASGTLTASFALAATLAGVGTLSGTMAAKTALAVTVVGTGTLNGTLGCATSLSGTMAGVGTLSGTLSVAGGPVALSATMAGVGTLTGTMAANTALSATCAGAGALTGTMVANTALSVTMPGTGTLAGTMAAKTALALTMAGAGQLSGTMAATTALTDTLAGVGTLTGTLALATALTVTCAGVGTLTGTLSAGNTVALAVMMAGSGQLSGTMTEKTALSVTATGSGILSATLSATTPLAASITGVGTLAGTLAATTALSVTCTGAGTLSGVMSIRIALSLVCAGAGTLSGVFTIPSLIPGIKIVWVTRDMKAPWTTRDMKTTWTTRDERATWGTRDEKATWTARDGKVTWETRGG